MSSAGKFSSRLGVTVRSIGIAFCLQAVVTAQNQPHQVVTDSAAAARDSLRQRLRAELLARRGSDQKAAPVQSATTRYHDSLTTWLRRDFVNAPSAGFSRYPGGLDEMLWRAPLIWLQPWRRLLMRTTAAVAGQEGEVFSTVFSDITVSPFEQPPQPNGSPDLLSLPDMMSADITLLPAGLAQQLGGRGICAAALLPDSAGIGEPLTTLLHDRGTGSYSYTRGRYLNHFRNGRELNLGLGYRYDTDPATFFRTRQYQYAGSLVQPLGSGWELRSSGTLNDLEGPIQVEPDHVGGIVHRELQQRQAHVGLTHTTASIVPAGRSVSDGIIFDYSRQHSDADGALSNRLDEWRYRYGYEHSRWTGQSGLIASLAISSEEYRNSLAWHRRSTYQGHARYLRKIPSGLFGSTIRLDWPDHSHMLLSLSAIFGQTDSAVSHWFGAAYESRAPNLNELFLPARNAQALPAGENYFEQGNSRLAAERMLAGSYTLNLSGAKFSGRMTAMTGLRDKAILWTRMASDSGVMYQPTNSVTRFAGVGVSGSYIAFTGGILFGGAGGWMTSGDHLADRPHLQGMLGADLTIPISAVGLLVHGSSELRYLDSYRGYNGETLAGKVESYSTLSVLLRSFEFHWIILNGLNATSQFREGTLQDQRLDRFGFVWHFAD